MKLDSIRELESVPVFKNGIRAGTLFRRAYGAIFIYDEQFRRAALSAGDYGICFSLPPEQESYESRGTNLHPFFANLLPEGLRFQALQRTLKTSADDLFSLLAGSGVDTVGDVYVTAAEDVSTERSARANADELGKISFDELFQKSILSDEYRARLRDPSIPGIMPKISASMISFPVGLRRRKKKFILKLQNAEHPQLVENEHFFMTLARKVGLSAASTEIVRDKDGRPGLLVERFDRTYDSSEKRFRRLHLEDACQVLARYPQDKYRLSFSEILRGLGAWCSSPTIEFREAIKLYAFNFLIGNGDFHAKNISLIEQEGRITLSPAYDILSTLPYGDQSMALKLGTKNSNFTIENFIEFGEQFEIPAKAIRSLLTELQKGVLPAIKNIPQIGLKKKETAFLQETIRMRSEKLFP